MARHAPSHRRELLRRFKQGEPPLALLKEANTIAEPGHAAIALLTIAADERVDSDRARSALQQARQLIDRLDRPARIAEAWAEALPLLATWRPGEWEQEKEEFPNGLLRALERMPDGEWKQDVIVACAPHLPVDVQERVMQHALSNHGFEVASSKAVWDHGDQDALTPLVKTHPEIAARLLARAGDRAAIDAAWAVPDAPGRIDALRVLVWQAEDAATLQDIVDSGAGRAAADRAQVLTMVGAREDRLGIGDPAGRFADAASAIDEVPEAGRDKLRRKLDAARERAGLSGAGAVASMPDGASAGVPATSDPVSPEASSAGVPGSSDGASLEAASSGVSPASDHPPPESTSSGPPAASGAAPTEQDTAPADIPVDAGPRHVLALVDGYSGGLGNVHLRAVARAAPLCVAFGLDLALVGFPVERLEPFVDLVEADTGIGEGAGHLEALLGDGRLHLLPLESGLPAAWPGHPLATTPHPETNVPLDGVEAPVCLLLGLGRQGIPRRMLARVPHHELTGEGISLETATAMGILADRLGRVPL